MNLLQSLYGDVPARPKVFVSYHHGAHTDHYGELSRLVHDQYELCTDNSLIRAIDSDDPAYVMRRIRENYITGTSCTVVLCGATTPGRKYVDWEISATLDKGHSLLGIVMPDCVSTLLTGPVLPARLEANYWSGYAGLLNWHDLFQSPSTFALMLAELRCRSRGLIANASPLRARDSSLPW